MIQHDGEGKIALGPSMVPEAMQIPCNEEIMPQEEAGSPPSPVTIHAALTNNDNMSEGTVPLCHTRDNQSHPRPKISPSRLVPLPSRLLQIAEITRASPLCTPYVI